MWLLPALCVDPTHGGTSDKHEGAVVTDTTPGHDPQGVQPLVILVQVAEGQRGLAFSKEHLRPLGLFQQHV